MKFVDTALDRENRFSIGREAESGRCYLSIPVSNSRVDYEEYYEIASSEHDAYPSNAAYLKQFATECRLRQHDNLLIIKPGKERGIG